MARPRERSKRWVWRLTLAAAAVWLLSVLVFFWQAPQAPPWSAEGQDEPAVSIASLAAPTPFARARAQNRRLREGRFLQIGRAPAPLVRPQEAPPSLRASPSINAANRDAAQPPDTTAAKLQRGAAKPDSPAYPPTLPAPHLPVLVDRRVSGRGPQLSPAELHGGWRLTQEVYQHAREHPNATVISADSPRVLLIRDFLSPTEVAHLVSLAEGEFTRSEVVTDGGAVHDTRTSSGSWLNGRKRDDVVLEVQRRIAQAVGIPEAFGEALYVLRYERNQQYNAHADHCSLARGQPGTDACTRFLERAGGPGCGLGAGGATCGDRVATFILYLKAPARGGATVFPHAHRWQQEAGLSFGFERQRRRLAGAGGSAAVPADPSPWYCAEGARVLRVQPPAGSAVFFWDWKPLPGEPGAAVPDPTSLHAGCPVLEGEKWIATRWMRSAEFH